ncbi:hypothetical protein DCC81_20815 [Chitinophaga parva]|uniref:Uncharacterized protein n=1 Tax=Chitinophaga parva TaxID=2169414 RepID=A0A2T7BCQ8_9BACT|nr:hypothetical protein [Chitinophaga parva]PUZ22865.1 hypothetical protein DCC81_20815 [Chitinophaga parva]
MGNNFILNKAVKQYVTNLAVNAQENAILFPVDRDFLLPHLNEIESLQLESFLYYNFELVNDTYVNELFVCLPEVWARVDIDMLLLIAEKFTNVHSYFSLIKFTYKYIEIDIIRLVMKIAQVKNIDYLREIIAYLERQWNVLIKTELDREELINGVSGVSFIKWQQIKWKFLEDERVQPAQLILGDVKQSIFSVIQEFKS